MFKLHLCAFAVGVLCVVGTSRSALADAELARLGQVMWAAFECGTYAEMSGDKDRGQAFYRRGIEAGRRFLTALRDNQITTDELRSLVPIGVTLRLGGDSDDLIIGRILEGAISDSYDSVVGQDANGTPLEASNWVTDETLKTSKASSKFQSSNCELVD